MNIDNSASTQEAKAILSHLLRTLRDPSSKYENRYGSWVREWGEELEEYLFACLRKDVLRHLQLGNGNVNSLKNIGGDLSNPGRAIYLHGILGLDKRTRIYVGQSTQLLSRIRQHSNFRYRRDNPSLHYFALQNSVFDSFVILTVQLEPNRPGQSLSPGHDCPDLTLNVLEMWCCLIFRTLPMQTLETFLPESVKCEGGGKLHREGVEVGLNIACPLDHGDYKLREWVDLSNSDDLLVQDYIREHRAKGDVVKVEKPQQHSEPLISPNAVLLAGAMVFLGFAILKGGSGSVSGLRQR